MKTPKKIMVWYLVGVLFIVATAPRGLAGFSPSEVVFPPGAEAAVEMEKLRKFLEAKMVRERLKDLGLAPEEIQAKMAGLDDLQVRQMALRIEEMQVAGDGGEILVIAFLAAVLAVLIIYATGHRIILK